MITLKLNPVLPVNWDEDRRHIHSFYTGNSSNGDRVSCDFCGLVGVYFVDPNRINYDDLVELMNYSMDPGTGYPSDQKTHLKMVSERKRIRKLYGLPEALPRDA